MAIQKKVDLGTWLESKGKEDVTNKVTTLSSSSTDDQYPSAKLVYDELETKLDAADVPTKTSDLTNDGADGTNAFITAQDITGKENSSNKVTSLSSESTDTQYPSAKLVYDELATKADADDIPTKTSDLTNDGDGTNAFLTQHQDISGKENSSNKVTSLSSESTDTQYPSAKLVYDELATKADSASLATVATTGDYDDLTNKPTIPTVDQTIIDGSSNAVAGNAVYDALALKSDTGHTHTASEVIDSTAHSNLNTAANATQATINTAIDSAVGSILAMEMIVVDTADAQGKPSTPASASTMNKLYLTKPASGKEDNYAEFITVRTGTSSYTYSWEKIGDVSLDLSGYVRKEDVDLEIVNDELILTVE